MTLSEFITALIRDTLADNPGNLVKTECMTW